MTPLISIVVRRHTVWRKIIKPVVKVLLSGFFATVLNAQIVNTQSSFSDKFELADPKSVITSALADNESLLKQNLILQEQVRSLTESLILARSEVDNLQDVNREMKTRGEALGLNAVGSDRAKLEQRLIKSVSDLSVAQESLTATRKTLASLAEAVLTLLKTSREISPDSRLAVEAELRAANQGFGIEMDNAEKAEPMAANLTNARVVSYKPEIGLLVGNIGSNDSVKIGMPFRVYDGQKAIALVRVVDVREKLFGALIQETISESYPVKVGCRLKVAAN